MSVMRISGMNKTLSGILFALCLCAFTGPGSPGEIPLWPAGAPGSQGKTEKEKARVTEQGDHVISGIHSPSLTPYLPAAGKSTGVAIIIAPGGGHRELWIDHEGYRPAAWLRDHGIAAFVLKYRLAREENSTYTVNEHALADIQRAIRLIKNRAHEWAVDTSRIGVMGFSAGGELAALAAMQSGQRQKNAVDPIDRESARPAFQALIYPGNSGTFVVDKNSPPLFIVAGYHDRPDISKGMAELYLKYKEAGVPAELHIYSQAAHGFGMRDSNKGAVAGWPQRLVEWLSDAGFIKNDRN
jgi:acetyl esterase/lipase